MQSLSCENEFYLHENKRSFFISMASHLASLGNKSLGQFGNGLQKSEYARGGRWEEGKCESLSSSLSRIPIVHCALHFPSARNLVPRVFWRSYDTEVASGEE